MPSQDKIKHNSCLFEALFFKICETPLFILFLGHLDNLCIALRSKLCKDKQINNNSFLKINKAVRLCK
jgi:hypothetical protein